MSGTFYITSIRIPLYNRDVPDMRRIIRRME